MNFMFLRIMTMLCFTGCISMDEVTTQSSTETFANSFTTASSTSNKKLPRIPHEKVFEKTLYSDWANTHGFVQVRRGAWLFYWLFYADGTRINATKKPLIIWIQGGPGFAASGVGNFGEIGPFNMDLEPRNHTWVKGRNLLLIDHPVGTGFSFVKNSSLYVKTDKEMAMDLTAAIKGFYKKHPTFVTTPAYLFGQSYGGKTCPRLGLYLHKAIQTGSMKMNFKGIGIGSGWVHPRESLAVQARFLYFSGVLDRKLYLLSSAITKKLIRKIDMHDYFNANILDNLLFSTLNNDSLINFNNVYKPNPRMNILNHIMNKKIRPLLKTVNQTRNWRYLSMTAYNHMKKNFLKPTTSFVERLLNKTELKLAVYNGNLDAVTPLAAACDWVHNLKWSGAEEFEDAKRHKIRGRGNGYYKELNNLSFWWVFDAGHWIPEDNPQAMAHILDYMTSQYPTEPTTTPS